MYRLTVERRLASASMHMVEQTAVAAVWQQAAAVMLKGMM
jgi:hypothetical protein